MLFRENIAGFIRWKWVSASACVCLCVSRQQLRVSRIIFYYVVGYTDTHNPSHMNHKCKSIAPPPATATAVAAAKNKAFPC